MKKHRCKVCKGEYVKQTSLQQWCSPSCGFKLSQIKLQKKQNDKHKELKKKVNRENTRHQHKLTQAAFNKLRVLEELQWFKERGLEPECISCGKVKMDWCCGHFKTRGAQSGLRYDKRNTFLQCNRYCNMALSGNIEGNKTTRGYKKGLIERFGEKEGNSIIEYCESATAPVDWSGEELIEFRKNINKKIRELKAVLDLN